MKDIFEEYGSTIIALMAAMVILSAATLILMGDLVGPTQKQPEDVVTPAKALVNYLESFC